MFRELRRIKNKMSDESAKELLQKCQEGTLGTISSDNMYPYTVVVNYIFYHNKIYFHSAKSGHKIDNILANPKVSFTVYDNVEVIQETFTTKYQSVTLFGQAKIVKANKEILFELIKKYSPDFKVSGREYIDSSYELPVLVEIEIEHLTGKERV